ncbi:hypothetical protein XBLMG947_1613 [Xanthomonas bromi]|uniref:Uncharacterized protein n=1 Tax=Xanthomonas bromi TaxID=56449 RepID=A0A1C3NKD7_9XANT|nr:hypothetical protein XBLMG947_1613 [Xanthomonas bromi]
MPLTADTSIRRKIDSAAERSMPLRKRSAMVL